MHPHHHFQIQVSILHYPSLNEKFYIGTDASNSCIASVLYQEYASSLNSGSTTVVLLDGETYSSEGTQPGHEKEIIELLHKPAKYHSLVPSLNINESHK